MDELTDAVLRAVERAGISGLCREGQLEIAVQEARKFRPDLDEASLLELVHALLAEDAGFG